MLRLWLLGPLRLEVDGVEVPPPSSRRARLLLARLALERRPHSREALAAGLWPDVLDESARVSLRTVLVRLRSAIGPEADSFLDTSRGTVALAGPDQVWTDVGELEHRLQAGEVEAALELCGEELLTGLEDDWVYERREELRQRLFDVIGRRAGELEAAGDLPGAVRLTRRQTELEPLAEAPQRDLIRRLAVSGDRAAALAAYEKLAQRLREQLRTVPSAATRELVEAVRSDVGPAPARTAGPAPPEAPGPERSTVAPPETRYARSGEVSIAYQVVGDGPLDLVFVTGAVSHLDLQWTNRAWAQFLIRLASFSRLILFDKRGTGLSDPVSAPPAFDERMDDVRAVMDAVGSERAAVLGYSDGGLMAALFAATHPERTEALILWDTFATPALDAEDRPDGEHWLTFRRLARDALDHWGEGRFLYAVAPTVAVNPEIRRRYGLFERAAVSPAMVRANWAAIERSDIRPVLPTIRVPTLVIDFADSVIPGQGGRYLAEHIPGARFVELEGRDHLPLTREVPGVADEIDEFLTGARRRPEPDRVLATVLVTDIVGSAERAAAVGDSAWRELLGRHDDAVRTELERFGGREVKRSSDGFVATFDGPARAIRCALAIRDEAQRLGLAIRAGLHTGEIEQRNRHISGIAVQVAAQISTLCRPGEVLASRTVKDLVAGSGLRFADPTTHTLDAIAEPWTLYPVEQDEPEGIADTPPGAPPSGPNRVIA
jgi:DNA-binding SARP family transcriptional activator/pimeloyl-ACP methyl ester carboxylesterase